MSFTSVLSPRAISDLRIARDWYNQKKAGLGMEFLHEIKLYNAFIKKKPFAFQTRNNPPVRCAPLRRFPFMIHYLPVEELQQIVILAVLHTSENPDNWPVEVPDIR
ncbi:MAG: type II toxin-antitoxin system RelE/ParE family toxin [Bacteroidota bacterium]